MKNYIKMVFFLFLLSAISATILTGFSLETKSLIEKNKQRERLIHILKTMEILPEAVKTELKEDLFLKLRQKKIDKETAELKSLKNEDEIEKLKNVLIRRKFKKKALSLNRTEVYLKRQKLDTLVKAFEDAKVKVLEVNPRKIGEIKVYNAKEFLSSSKINYLTKLYIFKVVKNNTSFYAFEVSGAGFWDKISGYLVVKEGFQYPQSISFFDHKETPGLGQRIEEGWFQAQFGFWNKKIVENATDAPEFHVTKRMGDYNGDSSRKKNNEVDAITGASETSRALDIFLTKNLGFIFDQLTTNIENKVAQDFFDLRTRNLFMKRKAAKGGNK